MGGRNRAAKDVKKHPADPRTVRRAAEPEAIHDLVKIGRRSGARRRERVTIRSCCFKSNDSATMARAPPGCIRLTVVTTR